MNRERTGMSKPESKAKLKGTVMVTDGARGMMQVSDHRFDEPARWPISFKVPGEQADAWMDYFSAECGRREWSSSSLHQIEASENSGTIHVNAGNKQRPQLEIVWERRRRGAMQIRARSPGEPELPLVEIQEFFRQVHQQCRSGVMEHVYRRGILQYEGPPWRGEFWLDNTHRLGPPSQQDDTALIGPRVIVVDAMVKCVGPGNAPWAFTNKLDELAAFLSVVMGTAVQAPEQSRRVWTLVNSNDGVDCAVRQLGYWERECPREMPAKGMCQPVPLRQVRRPDFSLRGIFASTEEMSLPDDVGELWETYRTLTEDQERQFLRAAAKWQEALMYGRERSTLSYALMVVACESLKPADRQYREHNIYQIVEALLGTTNANRLREHRPQDVRSAHLHGGEFRGSEFVELAVMSSYQDPTFDQARRALGRITQEAIIEWLRRRGVFTMSPIKRRKSLRRLVREQALVLLPIVGAAGVVLGWLLQNSRGHR